MKKPSKCASVRGMEGVLSLVAKTFLKNDPYAVLMVCKAGTVNAKIRQFIDLSKYEAIFFVVMRECRGGPVWPPFFSINDLHIIISANTHRKRADTQVCPYRIVVTNSSKSVRISIYKILG